MQRHPTVGVLLAVEVFIGLQSRIFGVTELSRFFIGKVVAGLQTFAGMRLRFHTGDLPR